MNILSFSVLAYILVSVSVLFMTMQRSQNVSICASATICRPPYREKRRMAKRLFSRNVFPRRGVQATFVMVTNVFYENVQKHFFCFLKKNFACTRSNAATARPLTGETGRNLNTRLTEHKRATRNGDLNNNIAEHHLQTNHRIDWDSAECVIYSTDYYQRLTLEIWFTNLEQTPLNRCQQLPAPYKRLINDTKTDKQ